MAAATTTDTMSPGIRKVMNRARDYPHERILSLAHHIDVPSLGRAFDRVRKGAASGVDGVTKSSFGNALEENLQILHERLRSGRWRHQPIRRVHIPKEKGKTRPIGISTLSDKLVQSSVTEVLGVIYEQDFLDCSYGFRPGRSAHDALRALNRAVHEGGVQWIIEAERMIAVLPKRMARFGLSLHSDKTRLLSFGRPAKGTTKRCSATFDFLGFTHYWRRTRGGGWMLWCKTRHARQQRALRSIADWCRSHRHESVKTQHAALVRRLRGHFNYFGVNGNLRSLTNLVQAVRRIWLKWLQRRSQRSTLTWESFHVMLERYPLPVPRVIVQIWGT